MAIYINNRKWIYNQSSVLNGMVEIREYFVDRESDIALLPDQTQTGETSTALVIDTGNVYVLAGAGWRKL